MKHGKDDNVMLAKGKEDFIREPPEKRSAHGLVDERMLERVSKDAGQCRVNGQKKFRAKSLNPGFIPLKASPSSASASGRMINSQGTPDSECELELHSRESPLRDSCDKHQADDQVPPSALL